MFTIDKKKMGAKRPESLALYIILARKPSFLHYTLYIIQYTLYIEENLAHCKNTYALKKPIYTLKKRFVPSGCNKKIFENQFVRLVTQNCRFIECKFNQMQCQTASTQSCLQSQANYIDPCHCSWCTGWSSTNQDCKVGSGLIEMYMG